MALYIYSSYCILFKCQRVCTAVCEELNDDDDDDDLKPHQPALLSDVAYDVMLCD